MTDGLYFLLPEGGGWIGAIVTDGKLTDEFYEQNAATHAAARDAFAGLVPQETDELILDEEADDIIRLVMKDGTDPEMVTVTRGPS
jgi:hypothetical protein